MQFTVHQKSVAQKEKTWLMHYRAECEIKVALWETGLLWATGAYI